MVPVTNSPIQHYISKFLTKPWEYPKGTLNFFNFTTGMFEKEGSEKLLGDRNLWDQKYERIFDKLFETQLADQIKSFTENDNMKSDTMGALKRMYFIQVERVNAALRPNTKVGFGLDYLCNLSKDELDQLVQYFSVNHEFVKINTRPDERIFFPEDGCFNLPTYNISEDLILPAIAIPLSPRCAIAAVKKGWSKESVNMIIKTAGSVTQLSIGVSAQRIIVHPDHLANTSEAELRDAIMEANINNSKLMNIMKEDVLKLKKRIEPVDA